MYGPGIKSGIKRALSGPRNLGKLSVVTIAMGPCQCGASQKATLASISDVFPLSSEVRYHQQFRAEERVCEYGQDGLSYLLGFGLAVTTQVQGGTGDVEREGFGLDRNLANREQRSLPAWWAKGMHR